LCAGTDKLPCEKCSPCINSTRGTHPDYIELTKDPDQQNIGIEQIREQVISRLQLSSFLNSYKIAIITSAQYLSLEAANALLKTLEEPRQKVIIILVTDELSALPATVVSRCQSFEFFPLSTLAVEQFIRSVKPDIKHASLQTIAALSRGRPGRAWQLLNNPTEFERTIENYRYWRKILSVPIWQRFQLLNKYFSGLNFQDNKLKAEQLLQGLALVLRDETLRHHGLPGLATHLPDPATRAPIGQPALLPRLIRSLISLRRALSQNASPRLVLEQFCLEY
jgi:DNA polymerase-3 subunit delta'